MVISGKGSDRDISKALEEIKQKQMGKTHEISKNTESCSESLNPVAGDNSTSLREGLSGMVLQTD